MEKLRYLFENFNLAEMMVNNWDYDEESVKLFRDFRISSNAIYPFEIDGKTHFLRLSPDATKKVGYIEDEIAFTKYLRKKGYDAVNFIASQKGKLVESCDTPWGLYHASVMEGVLGQELEELEMDSSMAYKFGSALGRLHKISSTYDVKISNRMHCNEALTWCENYLVEFSEHEEIINAIQNLKPALEKLPKDKMQYGLIHYDFDLDNVFLDQNSGKMYVIDFDDCMMSWYDMDVVLSLDKLGDAYQDSFIKGYEAHYQIGSDFKTFAPIFRQFTLIYSYTRITRSIEEKWENEPTWMINLRSKFASFLIKTKEKIVENTIVDLL
jgi:Ser/Thr protein kinase RdoA (MazF antagonist)